MYNFLTQLPNALSRCHFALARCYQHAVTALQMALSGPHSIHIIEFKTYFLYPTVISGGPLPPGSEYELSDIRFHWGRYSTRGSEHKVNGKAFPMEVRANTPLVPPPQKKRANNRLVTQGEKNAFLISKDDNMYSSTRLSFGHNDHRLTFTNTVVEKITCSLILNKYLRKKIHGCKFYKPN